MVSVHLRQEAWRPQVAGRGAVSKDAAAHGVRKALRL